MPKLPIIHLNNHQLRETLALQPGLIPVDINLNNKRLIWLDMGRYHMYEGRFNKALHTCVTLNQQCSKKYQPHYFSSALSILDSDDLPMNPITPSGFIFHMSRCGSTLLAKALASSRHNLVFGEAIILGKFWQLLGSNQPKAIKNTLKNQRRFKQLILAMGRKRLPTHRYYFIKFTSIECLFIDIIMTTFPQVPALFLYRNPQQVLRSLSHKDTSWITLKNEVWHEFISNTSDHNTTTLEHYANTLQHCMTSMLKKKISSLNYLNYIHLNTSHLASLLAFFKVTYPAEEIQRMGSQFAHYSKSEYKNIKFTSDTEAKQKLVTPEITSLTKRLLQPYKNLLNAPENLI